MDLSYVRPSFEVCGRSELRFSEAPTNTLEICCTAVLLHFLREGKIDVPWCVKEFPTVCHNLTSRSNLTVLAIVCMLSMTDRPSMPTVADVANMLTKGRLQARVEAEWKYDQQELLF